MKTNIMSMFRLITIVGKITPIWPSSLETNYILRYIREAQYYFFIINLTAAMIAISCGGYYYLHEPVLLMKVLSEFTSAIIALINYIICRIYKDELHVLLAEVISFVKADDKEKKLTLQRWMDRYYSMWIFVIILYGQAAFFFSFGALMTGEVLPIICWYPFEVKPFTLRQYFIVTHQVFATFQTSMGICADITISFLLSYTSAKLEILGARIENSTNREELDECINEHSHCIHFFSTIANIARFMVLKNNLLAGLTIITGAIPLISDADFTEVSQFVLLIATSFQRMYMSTWPADDTYDMSEKIAGSFYNSAWIGASPQIQSSIIFAVSRAQKPFTIYVSGFQPPLTLQYFASFVSKTLSYFATLRAVLDK